MAGPRGAWAWRRWCGAWGVVRRIRPQLSSLPLNQGLCLVLGCAVCWAAVALVYAVGLHMDCGARPKAAGGQLWFVVLCLGCWLWALQTTPEIKCSDLILF